MICYAGSSSLGWTPCTGCRKMAAVEQPPVPTPGRPNNKEQENLRLIPNNGVDHHHQNIDAASALKQRMSGNGPMDPGNGPNAPPNGQNSAHESNGGPGGYPGGPGGYPGGPGYGYPGYGPPKGPPGGPGGYPGPHGPPYTGSGPPAGGPTPTLNSLLQDRGQRFPGSYEGGPPPGPGAPPGPPGGGYPGWGYQGHPHYRGQVNTNSEHRRQPSNQLTANMSSTVTCGKDSPLGRHLFLLIFSVYVCKNH